MDNSWKGIGIFAIWGALAAMVIMGEIHAVSWATFWAACATGWVAES